MKDAEPLPSDFVVGAPPSTVNVTLPVTANDPEVTVTVTMPSALYINAGALIVVVVGVWFTFCVMAGDDDVEKFVSPL